jgi:hypothetical protein
VARPAASEDVAEDHIDVGLEHVSQTTPRRRAIGRCRSGECATLHVYMIVAFDNLLSTVDRFPSMATISVR